MKAEPGGPDPHHHAQAPTGAPGGCHAADSGVQALAASALQEALIRLPHWHHEPERATLARRFVFADFAQAFGFMTEMAIWSEKHDHHPHWCNLHRRVDVFLTTHDVDGLSALDLAWAQAADAAAVQRTASSDAISVAANP
jgi:4a-hydroxytetrahydrobiopterin dehydratase